MVVTLKITGLNIVNARGKLYVYARDTGERLYGPYEGTKPDLKRLLADDKDFIAKWNARRRPEIKRTYEPGTLGDLVRWFENECPKYKKLSVATKKDYTAAFQHLRGLFDAKLEEFDTAELYDLRDKCAMEKWPRFADKMISALSSMFGQGVKRKKLRSNPARGIDKAHTSDKNANREWIAGEFEAAIADAPANLKTIMMIARHAGFRGQTIAALTWREYQADVSYGKCFRVVTRKNNEVVWVPAAVELQTHLDEIKANATTIATHITTRADGTPWENEVQMQTEISHYLRDLEGKGKIGAGTTLHGLRVTYAADLKRSGADTGDIAAALGDKSERMGAHYTRHVENEAKVIRAFAGKRSRAKNGE
jgi:integrase